MTTSAHPTASAPIGATGSAYASGSTAIIVSNASMSWAASGSVDVVLGAAPPSVSVYGVSAMAWAATGAISVDVIAPGAVAADVQGSATMSWSATGSISADISAPLPTVAVDVYGAAAMAWAATGAVYTNDGSIIWPAVAARAIVGASDNRAIVGASDNRAIVPDTGDTMQPIKTFEQYRQDKKFYKIDFEAKYLPSISDTAQTLIATGNDPGVTVTSEVPVGGVLSSGIVNMSVDDPVAAGDYKVWAQIRTAGGEEQTGVIVVRVEDL